MEKAANRRPSHCTGLKRRPLPAGSAPSRRPARRRWLSPLIADWYGMDFVHISELQGRYRNRILIAVVALFWIGLYRYLREVGWL